MFLTEGKTYCLRENMTGREDGGCRFYYQFGKDALRFYFDVKDDEIVSPFGKDNEDIWQGDAVEVFLSPDGSLTRYYELEVSPFGVRFWGEISFPGGERRLKKLAPPFTAEARVTEYGYAVSVCLPLCALKGFERKKMKMNAFRLDKKGSGEQALYALQPTLCETFHRPAYFLNEGETEKMDGKLLIEKLLAYAKAHLYLKAEDEIYMRNVLLSQFGFSEPFDGEADTAAEEAADVPDALFEALKAFAVEKGLCTEDFAERYASDVFGMLTPLPSEVNRAFNEIEKARGAQAACDYLYGISVKNGYVQKTAIARNLKWEYADGDNVLEITVNLSKPEKSNKDIAKLLTAPQGKKYPACALCKENEGFEGTATHPPRRNIRTVKMNIGGEKWFMQYSPYAYYDEHCIAVNEAHTPMKVDGKTPAKLLDFVDALPNYFIGSNASLPIGGGSILTHEHFLGGRHLMPMHRAKIGKVYKSKEFPSLKIGILDWYNSALQCEGEDRAAVQAFAAKVIGAWKDYDCPACGILSHTGATPHNTLSPICRREGKKYIFTMILRNNRTDERFPDGIFHVHPEYLNIKSEGIGLIEAMGLFILPPRLKRQLSAIGDILCGKEKYDPAALADPANDLHVHAGMIGALVGEGLAKDEAEAAARVRGYVNKVCAGILDNTAVFKKDENGRRGFAQFMASLGLEE